MMQPNPNLNLAGVEHIPTRIICLTEMVTDDGLIDEEDYENIMQDVRDECSRFGDLVKVVVPRPNRNHDHTPGVGKVFLEYEDVDDASTARLAMNGRNCGGNQVVAVYYPEIKYI